MTFFSWILERLKEANTWYGLIAVISSAGVQLDPALTQQIAIVGVGAAGLVGIITKEKK
jgi:hypothetical protein